MKSKSLFILTAAVLALAACTPGGGSSSGGTSSQGSSGGSSSSSEPEPPVTELANGAYNFKNSGYAERTKILGALEKYAVDTKLTGISVVEDGGYVMYSDLVRKGAPNYIKGYGYGILAEGEITGDLRGEEEAKYKRYYHTYESEDPNLILYMNDKGSVVSGLVGYVSGSHYDIVMNEERTDYKWVGDLATNDTPIAVDPAADGSSRVYRFPVKTGEALKYSTLTQVPELAAFNNRPVALEDYVTSFKILYTAAYGMKRNSEIKDSNAGSLVGGETYRKASTRGFDEELWEKVGIKTGTSEEIGDYIEFTMNAAYTPFYARYYLTSSMCAPVPAEFIEALGGGNFAAGTQLWGQFNNTATLSPVDTFLSTGPYVLEEWVKDSKITFKRNPNYVSGENRGTQRPSTYAIEGVYVDIIPGLKNNIEAAFAKFINDQLHVVTIPATKIEEFINDPRTTLVPGQTTTKLNLNTCDEALWEQLFGENGTITQTAREDYWDVKPAMANKHFIDGLSYSIDRTKMAHKIGRLPSNNYFGGAYYADPENNIFYNDTPEHAAAVAESLEGTDGYGFSFEKAVVAFQIAAEELIAEGAYAPGDTITIEMAWQTNTNVDYYGDPIAKFAKDAWEAANTGLNLEFEQWVAANWSDVYYEKMMVGQFDIGFGSISGNAFDPINFLEVLKSDNSSTFTLNWGVDTNADAVIVYDGKLWSFDALWECADHGGYVKDGKTAPTFDCQIGRNDVVRLANGDLEVNAQVMELSLRDEDDNVLLETQMSALVIYAFTKADYSDYIEIGFYPDGSSDVPGLTCTWVMAEEPDENGYRALTVVIPGAFIDQWLGIFEPAQLLGQGFDVYRTLAMFGGEPNEAFFGTQWVGYIPEIPAE